MTTALMHAFRHDAWANRILIASCSELDPSMLEVAVPGTYGGIRATLHHIVEAEADYEWLITGEGPGWRDEAEDPGASMERIATWAADMAVRWEALLEADPDPERSIQVPARRAPFEERVGVLLAQTLHHGSEHRAHVGTQLHALGLDAPDLDAWAYGRTLRA